MTEKMNKVIKIVNHFKKWAYQTFWIVTRFLSEENFFNIINILRNICFCTCFQNVLIFEILSFKKVSFAEKFIYSKSVLHILMT